MDLPELGNGAQASATAHQIGIAAEDGGKPKRVRKYTPAWYLKNKTRVIAARRKYEKSNPEKVKMWNKSASKKYRERHLERRRKSAREWGRRNRKSQVARNVKRYHTDLAYNIRIKLSRRIGMALRTEHFRIKKFNKTIDLLGCSYEHLIERFKTMMPPGTALSDLFTSKIHIDHIKPCVKFDLTNAQEQRECFHYTNLQPLLARDNIIKKDKFCPGPHQPLLV